MAEFGAAGANIGRALSFAVMAEAQNRQLPKSLRKALNRMVSAFAEVQRAAAEACAEIDKIEQ
jgi:hypothetical protein